MAAVLVVMVRPYGRHFSTSQSCRAHGLVMVKHTNGTLLLLSRWFKPGFHFKLVEEKKEDELPVSAVYSNTKSNRLV